MGDMVFLPLLHKHVEERVEERRPSQKYFSERVFHAVGFMWTNREASPHSVL
jgi:hypothetical protein